MANACTWKPPMMTLATGETVPSDSEAWRAECEAFWLLSQPVEDRRGWLAKVTERRGEAASNALRCRAIDLEPYYLLGLPGIAARRAYLTRVRARRGDHAADGLEERARTIWSARKADAA